MFALALLAGWAGNDNRQTEIIRKVKIEPVRQADSLLAKHFSGIIREAGEVNLVFQVVHR